MIDLTSELWLPVVDWEVFYEVSEIGGMRSLDRIDRLGRHFRGRTLKPYMDPSGYPRVNLSGGGRLAPALQVHRLLMAAFAGPCPPGQEVRHWDGNPANCTLSNLLYGTRSDQRHDDVRNGRHFNASKTHCPKNHEYTSANTGYTPVGGRFCRICATERKVRWYLENKDRMNRHGS